MVMATGDLKRTDKEESPLYPEAIKQWCLRILVLLGGHRKFIEKDGFSSDAVLDALGLAEYAGQAIDRFAFLKLLKQKYAESGAISHAYPETLSQNLVLLRERISLNEVESDILAFTVMASTEDALDHCTDLLGKLDKGKLIRALAIILKRAVKDITRALATNGQLAISGLLRVDSSWTLEMKNKIDLMSGLGDQLLSHAVDTLSFFAGNFSEGIEPRLKEADFAHIKESYGLLRNYLGQVLKHEVTGVNVLIHGAPGTGKTEMVRVITRDIHAQLFEISFSNAEDDPLDGKRRFSSYQVSQQVLRRTPRAVVLFDEVEDVFPGQSKLDDKKTTQEVSKAWINSLLESNPVPAFWLSNRAYHIDPAFLRRFDYVLEMPEPTRSVRQRILTRYVHDLPVQHSWIEQAAEHVHLPPAYIERAARVATRMGGDSADTSEKVMEQVLRGHADVLRMDMPPLARCQGMPTRYSLDLITADTDIPALIGGIKRGRQGNICFYGPPGTGKSALARHMARALDRPLLAKRASDLLSKWLGKTEQLIAQMFREAERENAVLLLDEADSFLRDRRGAHASWEVTQVNELLVQMEHFSGLFICSTNLMDDLDQASLRRFALKIHFDYLTPEKAWKMFRTECEGRPALAHRRLLAAMTNLTPGDFAAVKRRLEILGKAPSPQTLIAGLEDECQIKEGGSNRPIGFREEI